MSLYAAAVFFLIITPGPGVLSVAGVGSAFGYAPGRRYLWGLCLGNFLVGLAVVSGLAAILLAVPWLRTALLIVSAGYLGWLAWRIAASDGQVAFSDVGAVPGLRHGISLQLVNPKAYAVNTTLFTGFNFLPQALVWEIAFKFLILNAIWIPIHFLWLWAGVTLRRLDLPGRWMRVINIAMGLCLAAVVVLALGSL